MTNTLSYQEYTITDEKKLFRAKDVKGLLDGSYWAPDRSLELISTAMKNSICIAVLHDKQLVAFARVVTDHAVFAWIADVIVDPEHRGKGLGKQMMQFIQEHPDIPATRQVLKTRDAHTLYERYGFVREEFMMK